MNALKKLSQTEESKTITTYEFNQYMNLIETYITSNGKPKLSCELVIKPDAKIPLMDKDSLLTECTWMYVDDAADFREYLKHTCDTWNNSYKPNIYSSWKQLKTIDIKEKNFFFNHNPSGLVFDSNLKPVSKSYLGTYIGGFQTKNGADETIWNKIVDIMKNNKYVENFSVEEIPYYNEEFSGQVGLHYNTVIPQDVFEEVFNKTLDYCNEWNVPYPSVKLKEQFISSYSNNICDIYGIRELYNEYKKTAEDEY
jgi:hypothetical protein